MVEGKNQLTEEAVTTLTGITTRVDTRLAEAQAAVDEVQSDIDTFQVEMDETEARLLLIYNLTALALTLLMFWLIYSQVVVIRHHWRELRGVGSAAIVAPQPAPATPAPEVTLAPAVSVPVVTDLGGSDTESTEMAQRTEEG